MAAEEANHDRDRHSDLAVLEANEYKQKRRLERILDAHDQVEERASDAFASYAQGEISQDAKNVVLLEAVKRYIREVYQLLRDYERNRDEDDPSYLYRETDPPLGQLAFDHGGGIEFRSLADVLMAETTYSETWEETEASRHGPDRTVEHSEQYTTPEIVSWNAYLLTSEFLTEEHDLELQFEELGDSLPTWGYEEIPDEEGTEVESDHYDPDKNYGPTTEAADGDD